MEVGGKGRVGEARMWGGGEVHRCWGRVKLEECRVRVNSILGDIEGRLMMIRW